MRYSSVLGVAFVGMSVLVAPVEAYELDPGPFLCYPPEGNSQWNVDGYSSYRTESVTIPCNYPLLYSPPMVPGMPPITLNDLHDMSESVYRQWHHDGWSMMRLSYDRYSCVDHGGTVNDGSWNDNGNELSEIWWSTAANTTANAGAWASERTDHEACFFGGDGEYLASDIDMTDETGPIRSAQPDTMWGCLARQLTVADGYLHEVGHSYGIKHNNAWLTTMNENIGGHNRSCNVQENWEPKPWADETQAMMDMYGWSNWTTRVDVTGSHNFGPPNGVKMTAGVDEVCQSLGWNTLIPGSSPMGPPDGLGWTFGNHYRNPGGIWFRYLLLPEADAGSTPLVQIQTSSTWGLISSVSTFPGASYSVENQTIRFNAGALAAGGTRYRVWVQLVPVDTTGEIDRGDNVFPLNYLIRVLSC